MLDKVRSFMDENQMIGKGDKIVIGISGGADSICLFFVLLEMVKDWHLLLHIVHVNHGIRGMQADQDEAFVRNLAKTHGIPYRCVKEDVKGFAKESNVSIEEAGRIVRYRAFEEMAKELGNVKIAVAHNKNDQVETVLFRLCRGTGLKGLTGMAPVRNNVIRPLLCVNRAEIEEFLIGRNITYREDLTNFEEDYTRNRIRHKVIPLLEKEVNVGTVEHIAHTVNILMENQKYIEKKVKERFFKIVTEKDGLYFYKVDAYLEEDVVIQKELLRHILRSLEESLKNIGNIHIDALRDLAMKPVGKRVNLPNGVVGVREYDAVKIGREQEIKKHGEREWGKQGGHINKEVMPPCVVEINNEYKVSFEIAETVKKIPEFPNSNCTKWLDYDKIKNTVLIRSARGDDYFVFNEKGNKKKLSRYFIDQKMSRGERERCLVLAEGSHVIWLLGGRISEAYKINKNTKRILKIKIQKMIDKGEAEV